MTPIAEAGGLLSMLAALRPAARMESATGDEAVLTGLATQSFETVILEALLERKLAAETEGQGVTSGEMTSRVAADPEANIPQPVLPPRAEALGAGVQGLPSQEVAIIDREAARTGVDPLLLAALRRAENGGPGREFGVVSVSAPSIDEQARVAATTIRNTASRYERQGGEVLDPGTGRYSEGFLQFLSARYAPIGAENDPTGLNRHHARNLIALYRQACTPSG